MAAGGEEQKDTCKVIEEDVLVACLDGEVEHVLTAGVAEAEKLLIPF